MRERIKLIMDAKRLRPSSFADKVGISRPTISQIVGVGDKGRKNDPSIGTIEKILKAFPDISQTWFYSGEGSMYNREQLLIKPASSSQPDLFDGKQAVESSAKPRETEYPQKTEDKKPENKPNPPVIQDIIPSNNISKKIDSIIIYFNDNTYMTFISKD